LRTSGQAADNIAVLLDELLAFDLLTEVKNLPDLGLIVARS
jgi:hypothetical protein